MAAESFYRLTRIGRRVAGSITPARRDPVLDYLYSVKGRDNQGGATLSELQAVSGVEKAVLASHLSRYVSHGYIVKEGGS